MIMNLSDFSREFFESNDLNSIADIVCLLREDGVVLYSSSDNDFDSQSIAALSSGLWQAAFSLKNYIKSDGKFRLGFDTSDSGIFMLDVKAHGQKFILCVLYKNVLNPAKMKQKFKNYMALFEQVISDYNPADENKGPVSNDRSGYLFSNITDEEMDQLFNF